MPIKPSYLEIFSDGESASTRPLLAVHGLNQNPASLKPLLSDLAVRNGLKIYLLHLHRDQKPLPSSDLLQTVSEEFEAAYRYIMSATGVRPLFFGYSMGGLLGALKARDLPMEAYLLLAPALAVRPYTHLLKVILPFLRRVPSKPLGSADDEDSYRFYKEGVPREIYQTFFALYRQWITSQAGLPRAPGLVLVDPGDELVSARKLQRLVKEAETDWTFVSLQKRQAILASFDHLCIDRKTLGTESYGSLLAEVEKFLAGLDKTRNEDSSQS